MAEMDFGLCKFGEVVRKGPLKACRLLGG